MIHHAILGLTLVALTSTGPLDNQDPSQSKLSNLERNAVVQKFVTGATDCVVRAVQNRAASAGESAQLGELIVAVMPACVDLMRAMIDSFDQNFGEGSGEAFFSGSFLDLLPVAVNKRVNGARSQK
jgi:hypothetical protein